MRPSGLSAQVARDGACESAAAGGRGRRSADARRYFVNRRELVIRRPDQRPARIAEALSVWVQSSSRGEWSCIGPIAAGRTFLRWQAPADGEHRIRFVAAGQLPSGADGAMDCVYLVDTVAPRAEVSLTPLDPSCTPQTMLMLSWCAADELLPDQPVQISWQRDGRDWQRIAVGQPATGCLLIPAPPGGLGDEWRLCVEAVDRAGNLASQFTPALQLAEAPATAAAQLSLALPATAQAEGAADFIDFDEPADGHASVDDAPEDRDDGSAKEGVRSFSLPSFDPVAELREFMEAAIGTAPLVSMATTDRPAELAMNMRSDSAEAEPRNAAAEHSAIAATNEMDALLAELEAAVSSLDETAMQSEMATGTTPDEPFVMISRAPHSLSFDEGSEDLHDAAHRELLDVLEAGLVSDATETFDEIVSAAAADPDVPDEADAAAWPLTPTLPALEAWVERTAATPNPDVTGVRNVALPWQTLRTPVEREHADTAPLPRPRLLADLSRLVFDQLRREWRAQVRNPRAIDPALPIYEADAAGELPALADEGEPVEIDP